jgi:hypothetical protein
MKVCETANRDWNVRSLESDVAVDFCFLTLKTVPNQCGDKNTHFWPTETGTNQPPRSPYTRMMNVVQGQHGGDSEAGGQQRPEDTSGDIT